MATLKIHPIVVTTVGGHQAQIDGIDPANHDCLHGEIFPSSDLSRVRWNLNGIARDNHPDCNLDMRPDEMQELVKLAKNLGVS